MATLHAANHALVSVSRGRLKPSKKYYIPVLIFLPRARAAAAERKLCGSVPGAAQLNELNSEKDMRARAVDLTFA